MDKDGSQINKAAGRFTKDPAHELVSSGFRMEVNNSVLLYHGMSLADLAHVIMLIEIDLIPQDARRALLSALLEMHSLPAEDIDFKIDLVDVYTNRTQMLYQRTPETAGWLQAGRPRREVSTLAYLIVTRTELLEVIKHVLKLMETLLELCEDHVSTLLPDYTYLQRAHPTTLAHYMLTFVQHMARDLDRMKSAYKRTNKSPACTGSTNGSRLPIDRELVAELLGFKGLVVHTRDAMWQSDGPIELMSATQAILCNIDRLAEDLQIWATSEFNFIDLSESHSRISVIMPQKKNPDVPELVRGKTGRVNGNLISLLTLMKGQPLAYNKDNQEDKEPLFDTIDTVKGCVRAFADMVPALQPKRENMRRAALQGFATATDLADYLVRKGLPFRDAHEVVGKSVAAGIASNKDLSEMSLAELQTFSDLISADVFDVLTLEGSVQARDHIGGTAPKQVRAAVERARAIIKAR